MNGAFFPPEFSAPKCRVALKGNAWDCAPFSTTDICLGSSESSLRSLESAGTLWWVCSQSAPQQCEVTDASKAGGDLLLQQVAHEEAEAVPLAHL